MTCVSPLLSFPPVDWWLQILNADTIVLDTLEHFQKMSMRNRYSVPGAEQVITLTIPLEGGRDQRTVMKDLQILRDEEWKKQHIRTLMSVYGRSPFYEHYARDLEQLICYQHEKLVDLNYAALTWVAHQLGLQLHLSFAATFVKDYPTDITDLRKTKKPAPDIPFYYQVFGDRTGFAPGMSILDLLFCEGPAAVHYLKEHAIVTNSANRD